MFLITGARGSVARQLMALLDAGGLPYRAASSDPSAEVRLDLNDPETFAAALDGVDAVFLYANATAPDLFAAAAAEAGVRHVVLLSSSSVLNPDPESNPLAASHLAAERALLASPLRVTILRPGSFAGNARGWAWAARSGEPIGLPYPEAETDPVHETDLAEAALAVLTEPGHDATYYTLTGPESLTFTEQLAILGLKSETVTPEHWKLAMAKWMRADYADSLLDFWRSRVGTPATLTGDVELLTGHAPRTFARWAADNAAAFA